MNKGKTLFIICILFFILVFFIGCIQSSDNKTKIKKISAQTFSEYIGVDSNITNKKVVFYLESLQEGDKVVIQDKVDYITYNDELNATEIEFTVNTTSSSGSHISGITFNFIENITNIYIKGDIVKISFTIKHVNFSYNGWTYDCEVYEEGWNQEEYIANSFSQILPQNCISKV